MARKIKFLVGNESFTYSGTDSWTVYGGTGANYILIDNNRDNVVDAGAGNDEVITYEGRDVIQLGAGDDFGSSWGGNDIMQGGAGNDQLNGFNYAGQDSTFDGGTGNDYITFYGYGRAAIIGGDGNDIIAAAGSMLSLTGGFGADTFKFGPSGIPLGGKILDFNLNDKIDLTNFGLAESDLSLSHSTLTIGVYGEIWVGPKILGVHDAIDKGLILI